MCIRDRARMQAQLDDAAELRAEGVLTQINAHSGSDSWSEGEASEYFERVLGMEIPEGVSMAHETHRGRVLSNPFVAGRLCEQFDHLRLTLDLSHWVVVCERLLGETAGDCHEARVLRQLFERVDHIHARIGTPQAPQLTALPNCDSCEWDAAAARMHEAAWQEVWQLGAASGSKVMTVTPEYGPVPYTPMVAGTHEPLSDVWSLTNDASTRVRELFERTNFT
eukprot:TRINITY_DN3809_c0_g1_i2.p1 TRINITY_DN3809_c0_g1~~TRINITY_DN3809_c0_g1_i2.p1  ORF type:complete len:223 (+),score=30.20 TRINITY_DN3809_c0_g1_i2:99-767(+)